MSVQVVPVHGREITIFPVDAAVKFKDLNIFQASEPYNTEKQQS